MDAYALLRLEPGSNPAATAERLRAALGGAAVRTALREVEGMESAFGVGVSDYDVVVDVQGGDPAALAAALEGEPVDADASCVVAGRRREVFQDAATVRFYCLLERADGLGPDEFARRWQEDFVEVVHTTPGQIGYEQVVVDRAESERLAAQVGLPASGADGLAIGGFANLAGLEAAVSWANVDEPHRQATAALLAPRYRKILTPSEG